ncbi:MBL fold metallo-hydrolase [Pluralibacter gergoviae]|uniref:MBL fold metallo-hydrolase n=1 Tax=Pluralibacter gergoviae TaxID=61647 RepID=UPI0005EC18F1|nr:MBL fold metallo-hydrolase [Pluralibacter gergoviae]KJM64275.1 beta-lactamase [Pluralibacter gergoviae]OUR04379.1 MBL fold metallo-hydrolase [Pluralibacter gergoviae]
MNNTILPFLQMGDFQVTALSDGNMSASLELLSGIEKKDAARIQCNAGIAEPGDIHINCYLIQGRGRTILVDAGTGVLNHPEWYLKASLTAAGVSPDDVDTVILTHCHPDHIGGLLKADRRPVYQHAEIFLHPLEAEYWWDDRKQEIANERGQRNCRLVRHTLDEYVGRVRLFDGTKIAEGILPVLLPGHTPGHTGFRIDCGDKRLLLWGDIVHYPHIQSAKPEISILFDYDPAQAERTRKKVLDQAVREKMIIGGMHLASPGFARVLRCGNGYCITYLDN